MRGFLLPGKKYTEFQTSMPEGSTVTRQTYVQKVRNVAYNTFFGTGSSGQQQTSATAQTAYLTAVWTWVSTAIWTVVQTFAEMSRNTLHQVYVDYPIYNWVTYEQLTSWYSYYDTGWATYYDTGWASQFYTSHLTTVTYNTSVNYGWQTSRTTITQEAYNSYYNTDVSVATLTYFNTWNYTRW